MKIQECLYILVSLDGDLYNWLATCNRLQKINLTAFMEKNFRQNVPLAQYAQACGRSLATFRRDCIRELRTTPSRWLIAVALTFTGQSLCQFQAKRGTFFSGYLSMITIPESPGL